MIDHFFIYKKHEQFPHFSIAFSCTKTSTLPGLYFPKTIITQTLLVLNTLQTLSINSYLNS